MTMTKIDAPVEFQVAVLDRLTGKRPELVFDRLTEVNLVSNILGYEFTSEVIRTFRELEVDLDPVRNFFYEEQPLQWVTKDGKLPKRIGKLYHKLGNKLDGAVLSRVGDMANRYGNIGSQTTSLVSYS